MAGLHPPAVCSAESGSMSLPANSPSSIARAPSAAPPSPPRLVEVPDLACGVLGERGPSPRVNRLIQGENLQVLQVLQAELQGAVQCVFLDPPYNTGSDFGHYADRVEHGRWLLELKQRLTLMRGMLTPEGSLWITVDDHEAHYLKVACDEVMGRVNFIGTIIWEKADSPRMDAELISSRHDYLLVYARHRGSVILAKEAPESRVPQHYDRIAEDGRRYYLKALRAMGHADTQADRPTLYYPIAAPDGTEVFPASRMGLQAAGAGAPRDWAAKPLVWIG